MVEPHQFKGLPKKRPKRWLLIVVLFITITGAGFLGKLFLELRDQQREKENTITPIVSTIPVKPPKSGVLKQFTGEQFKELYRSTVYPNTQGFTEPPPITGNLEADNRIRRLAEERGYRMTSVPRQAIIKINEPRLDNDDLLQPLAAKGWQSLKEAARQAGLSLTLISAYRSPQYQRDLFTSRLYANGVTAEQVAAARADEAVKETLTQAALPGYSRHHTGYTVDLWCEDGSVTFLTSSCFQWIHANNYQHAKENGWIPSYPEGADEQGPEPEPWEYVWVGRDKLED